MDQVKEIAQCGVPHCWCTQLYLTNFDIETHTLEEFIKACKRIEIYDDLGDTQQDATENNGNRKPKKNNEKRKTVTFKNGKTGNDREGTNALEGAYDYCCMCHGKNSTHTTEQCKTLKFQIKKQKQRESEKDSSKFKTLQEEMHAVFKDLMKKEKAKTKRRRQRASDRVSEELNALDDILLSETSDEDASEDDEST